MAAVGRKLLMMGMSTILIPLGKRVLKKIAGKGLDKLARESRGRENESPVPPPEEPWTEGQ